MVRLLGMGGGRHHHHHNKQRQRSSPPTAAAAAASPLTSASSSIRENHPMYQYALDEYAQAVPPGTSNDDGKQVPIIMASSHQRIMEQQQGDEAGSGIIGIGISSTSSSASWSSHHHHHPQEGADTTRTQQQQQQQQFSAGLVAPSGSSTPGGGGFATTKSSLSSSQPSNLQTEPSGGSIDTTATTATATNHPHHHPTTTTGFLLKETTSHHHHHGYYCSPFAANETMLPDVMYEEVYGEAYTGGRIRYVYPAGYQSMRPRSCPWKLSIAVCLLFTWLSVFIVGHCSDQAAADEEIYYYDDNDNDNNNDAAAAANENDYYNSNNSNNFAADIDIRWCGSRPLYLMWVCSMLITGVSAAYCSVIGYIKVRDFAVANSRSQPPGVVGEGKSDYYVRIEERFGHGHGHGGGSSSSSVAGGSSTAGSSGFAVPNIYQSDGTPQFWGSHIYRPTQAAVAVTSR